MGATEAEALQAREDYKLRERTSRAIADNPTVYQYAMAWLPVAKSGVSVVTYNNNASHIQHLCNVIGKEYVREVTPLQIRKVYATEYVGMSDGHIKHARSLFASLFDAAIGDGLIYSNPVKSDTAKPHKGTITGHRAITTYERNLIETAATTHRIYPAAITMLYSGLRPQEVKALRIEDVDFDAGIIHVHSFVHLKGHNKYTITETGKTKKATRDVPLLPPVRKVLEGKTGLVISLLDGSPVTQKAFQSMWHSYCHAIEEHINGMTQRKYKQLLRTEKNPPPWKTFEVSPYDLRHSFVTWCRDNGVELHTVVDWMGHVNASMILHIYDEATTERSANEARKLSKLFDSYA